MRKLILAAALALSLTACANSPAPGAPSGPVAPDDGDNGPRVDGPLSALSSVAAPLDRTHVDEQALTAAYASLDVLLTMVDQLRDLGVLKPGTPKALKVKALIEQAQDGLNGARAVRDGLSTKNPAVALASATDAFRQITALLKAN